jgi:hypothetical protein
MGGPKPVWASGMSATCDGTQGSEAAVAAWSRVLSSTSLPHDSTLGRGDVGMTGLLLVIDPQVRQRRNRSPGHPFRRRARVLAFDRVRRQLEHPVCTRPEVDTSSPVDVAEVAQQVLTAAGRRPRQSRGGAWARSYE